LPRAKYPSDTAQAQFFDKALAAIASAPGVRSVAAVSELPFGGGWSTGSFTVEGYTPPERSQGPWGDIRVVNEHYAEAMDIPLKAGRFFNPNDRIGTQEVAVIDEVMAQKFWPNASPIGKRISFDDP